LVAVVFGLATAASGATMTVTADKTTYNVGETITLTIVGNSAGASAASITADLDFATSGLVSGPVLVSADTATSFGGFIVWIVGGQQGLVQGATGDFRVFDQVGGVNPLPISNDPLTAIVTFQADTPGTQNFSWGFLNFFGATGSGTSVVIVSDGCDDAIDNDGDGLTDYPDDPGCSSAGDLSERDPTLVCDDGVDNDGDGRMDFDPATKASPGDETTPPAGSGDPGCFNPSYFAENPFCQDGINNDPGYDSLMDYDAGLSANGSADPGGPDPNCVGTPWKNNERCGLGAELALLLPPLMWLFGRRRRSA
jgi:hypothetical protein